MAFGIEIAKESEYIAVLIKLLIRFLSNVEFLDELFLICWLLIDFKMSLWHRFKDIIYTLLNMLLANPSKDYAKNIFNLILLLDNQEYLYLITPQFIKLAQ